VTPESAAGGPLALVRDGDRIRLSVRDRALSLLVDDAELAARAAAQAATAPTSAHDAQARGYRGLFLRSVLQADGGCDFDFLRAGEMVARVPKTSG
ncbi:MAG: dihydroxy-acid dehydratase, partial [Burkholderiaceae bacterium]